MGIKIVMFAFAIAAIFISVQGEDCVDTACADGNCCLCANGCEGSCCNGQAVISGQYVDQASNTCKSCSVVLTPAPTTAPTTAPATTTTTAQDAQAAIATPGPDYTKPPNYVATVDPCSDDTKFQTEKTCLLWFFVCTQSTTATTGSCNDIDTSGGADLIPNTVAGWAAAALVCTLAF